MVRVERSQPAPKSLAIEALKVNGSYKEQDVTDRLREDFHDKCYICELKVLQDPEVEHRLPHKNGLYPERKFDWNNLFWACRHCNGVKNKDKYDMGIIDCCHEDPEERISFSLIGDDIAIKALDKDDAVAKLTAELIYETFNQKNTGIRRAACENRMNALKETMNSFYRELEKYKNDPDSKYNIRMMSALLRTDSAFAAFKRGYIRQRQSEYPELIQYVS